MADGRGRIEPRGRRAGITAARRPTPVASAVAKTKQLRVDSTGNRGAPFGPRAQLLEEPCEDAPSAEPTNEPTSPSTPPWMRKTRSTRRAGVPTARRMPISRDFCTTETMSTLAIPSATATTTKNWIMFFELFCAESPIEQLRVELHPAVGVEAGSIADVLRDALRRRRRRRP